MLTIDWRSPAVYDHTRNITAAGFAWEYLRRNDEYHQDYSKLMSCRTQTARALEAFSQRWGLRFRPRPK